MRLNIGVFQYKMRDEPSLKKIQRLENHLKKHTKQIVFIPALLLIGIVGTMQLRRRKVVNK